MKTVYIQKGYTGREATGMLNYHNSSTEYEVLFVDSITEIHNKPEFIIGSVEFLENLIGPRKPKYYPHWLKSFLRRNIVNGHGLTRENTKNKAYFVKPADGYKAFDGQIPCSIEPPHTRINVDDGTLKYIHNNECIFSEIVSFVDEWRYYVVNGKVVDSWWYKGNDETCESNPHGPPLVTWIPPNFCGAIDMGILDTGEFALVEVQHPYAIGWYGEQENFHHYVNFLTEGFKSLKI